MNGWVRWSLAATFVLVVCWILVNPGPSAVMNPKAGRTSSLIELLPESTVMAVAEAWSVDPTQVDTRYPEAVDGLLGTIRVAPAESPDDLGPSETGRPWWKLW